LAEVAGAVQRRRGRAPLTWAAPAP